MNKRIIIFSTYDWGGAGESALRITRSLRELGHEAVLIVKHKKSNEKFIVQVQEKDYIPICVANRIAYKIYQIMKNKVSQFISGKRKNLVYKTDSNYYFNTKDENIGFSDIRQLICEFPFKPDLIIIGWVSQFLSTYNMELLNQVTKAPVYWLTTDMAPLTGGCHYAWDCLGYTKSCSDCPAILTEEFKQDAKRNLALKLQSIQTGAIKVLAGSEWCRSQAKLSTLFKSQEDIPVLNGIIDQNIFNSRCRSIAKHIFNVPDDTKLIFTGATFTAEKRKGINYLVESLVYLYAQLGLDERAEIKVLVAGQQIEDNDFVKKIPFSVVPFDFIKDDRLLSLAYQAADLFVCSSIEDSGPMMVNEALACGTPVVGFDLGFVSDIVEHGKNGFRVPVKDAKLMAEYMKCILTLNPIEKIEFSYHSIQAINNKVSLKNLNNVIIKLTN